MSVADQSTRLRAERLATLSSCCGFLGETVLTDSAVILLFAGMLGAGEMLSLLTTAVLPLLNGLCILPMALLAMRIGMRKLIYTACVCASLAYFVAACAPFAGSAKVAVLTGAVFCFALSLTGFIAGWFPLLDSFLTPERRTGFLSRMRFCHQFGATLFLLLVGLLIGRSPSVGELQTVLFVAAVIFTGRGIAIGRIPRFEMTRPDSPGVVAGIRTALGNGPLVGFSLYCFGVNLAGCGVVPLTILYLKNGLQTPDNVVVLISACSLAGMLFGYLGTGPLLRLFGLRNTFLLLHLLFFLVNAGLFVVRDDGTASRVFVATLLMAGSFATASFSIVASAEMMKLAKPGNKVMAMAFNGVFFYGGSGVSRFLSSLLLGAGLFAAEWKFGTMTVCRYQTFFLVYAVAALLAAPFLLLVPAVNPEKFYGWSSPEDF